MSFFLQLGDSLWALQFRFFAHPLFPRLTAFAGKQRLHKKWLHCGSTLCGNDIICCRLNCAGKCYSKISICTIKSDSPARNWSVHKHLSVSDRSLCLFCLILSNFSVYKNSHQCWRLYCRIYDIDSKKIVVCEWVGSACDVASTRQSLEKYSDIQFFVASKQMFFFFGGVGYYTP